jgi:hypothetical protein
MATFSHPKFATASWQGNYFAFGPGPNDGVKLIAIDLEIAADELSAADVHRFIYLNSNTIVLDAFVVSDDLDAHATPTLTLDLGYDLDSGTDDDDYWLANSTVGQAGGTAASTAAPFVPGDNFFVQAKVETGAATGAAGTLTCYLLVAPAGAYAG